MRARALLSLVVAGALVGGCFGAPANTPPTVHAQASPFQAAVGEEVTFTGTALDAEGSVVRFDWDFEDDGVVDFTNRTRGAATHAYLFPGTYFARFTASDDRGASASFVVTVIVIARFVLRADWGADEGYIVVKPPTLGASNMTVVVSPSGAPAPFTFREGEGLEALNDTLLRVSIPRTNLGRYSVTRVEASYNGTVGGVRLFRAVPFFGAENDTSVVFHAQGGETRSFAGLNQTTAFDGTLFQDMPSTVAVRAFVGTGTSLSEALEGGVSTRGNYTFSSLTWNHSVSRDNGSFVPVTYAWNATGDLVSASEAGFSTTVHLTRFEGARFRGNLTREFAEGVGNYSGSTPGTAGIARYSLAGNQTVQAVDGNGAPRSALRAFGNLTLDGTLGGASYAETNLTERLIAADERLLNEEFFVAWNASGHIGATSLAGFGSRFLDSDSNGVANPDPRPLLAFESQYFFGLAPARLEEGDAFSVTSNKGASAHLTVRAAATEVLTASGFTPVAIEVVELDGTVGGAGFAGSLNAAVVRDGPHAGLRTREHIELTNAVSTFSADLTLVAKGP